MSALQLESFNRTASKGSGKLSRLFSAKKSPRDKTSPSPTSSMNLSPGSMGGPSTVSELLIYQPVRPMAVEGCWLRMLLARLEAQALELSCAQDQVKCSWHLAREGFAVWQTALAIRGKDS